MIQIDKTRATGIIGIALGVFVIIGSLRLPPSTVSGDVGPAVFPILSAVILIIIGTFMIIQKSGKSDAKTKPFFNKEEWQRFFILLGVYLLYFFLFWSVGFIIGTFIVMFILSTLFRGNKKVPWWQRLLLAFIVTAGLYLMFEVGLGLRLPVGRIIRFYL